MNDAITYQYYNSNMLLVINAIGLIRVVHTPFRVTCIESIDLIQGNTRLYVDEVLTNKKDELLYVINGQVYSYKHFHIHIKW